MKHPKMPVEQEVLSDSLRTLRAKVQVDVHLMEGDPQQL
jgi:hypothetical protein